MTTRARLTTMVVIVGWICLALACASAVLLPASLGTVALSFVATVALSADRRFGPLPAALLVMLVTPYDRAANMFLPQIAGVPVRPQDAALLAGLILSVPRIRPGSIASIGSPAAAAIAAFLLVGLVAMVIGFIGDNAIRDVLRDARWWFLYGGGLLALVTGVTASAVVRALLLGTTIFAGLVICVAVLPAFEDALKLRALEFDRGLLRMQFGNSTLLLATLSAATVATIRRPTLSRWAWVVLIATAIGLSLTRTFIVVAIGVMVLATIATLVDDRSRQRRALRPVSRGLPALAVGLGIVISVTLATFATSVTGFTVSLSLDGPPSSTIAGSAEDPLDRLLLQSGESGIQSLGGGRFQTYRRAIEVIAAGPIIGSGLGALVIAEYTFGGEEFDTPGKLPNVDNAWLTVGMKAGLLGIVAFGIMLGLGVLAAFRGPRWLCVWLVPAWLGILALTLTQSFATTGYGPFVLGLLTVLPLLGYTDKRAARARDHE
jgi:O-Antigen ligase